MQQQQSTQPERWDQEREAHWRAQQQHHQQQQQQHPPIESHERSHGTWEQQQHQHHQQPRYHHEMHYQDEGQQQQDGRPPAPRAHSYPPARPGASPALSAMGGCQYPIGSPSTHSNAYHPYAPAPKKALLFINTVPPSEAPVSTKPKRKRIMPEQLTELCALFDKTDAPTFDAREKVAQAVGMTNREVQVWFQNRRAKVNRERAAAQETNEVKPAPSPREPAPPLASFTSRFAAATNDEPASGIGEQAWRIRQEPRSVGPPPLPFRHQPSPLEPAPLRPPLATARSHPGPSGRYHPASEQQNGRPGIDLPSPQPQYLLPSPQASYRSPNMPQYSPSGYGSSFFGIPSPSGSSSNGSGVSQIFTPNPGSAYSASSGYFSHPSETPYSPNGPFTSPSGTFLRLSIDSPQHPGYSPRSYTSGAFSENSDPPIHLPPLVSPRAWSNMQSFGQTREQQENDRTGAAAGRASGHQRSQSDTAAEVPRLGPKRPDGFDAPPPNTSQPTSPASSTLHPPTGQGRSPQSQRATIQQRRRQHPRPSSLSFTSTRRSSEVEGLMGPPAPAINVAGSSGPSTTSAPGVEEGVGLGMLAMAGEMVEDEDDMEKEARQRYVATRKLSYQSLRDHAGKEIEMSAL